MSLERTLQFDKQFMSEALRCDTNHFMLKYNLTKEKASDYHLQSIKTWANKIPEVYK